MAQAPNLLKKRQFWQEALADLITDPEELLTLLNLDAGLLEAAKAAAIVFPLRVPKGFIARMEKGNPRDPLLLQVLPLGAELTSPPDYQRDALQEKHVNPIPGLLHKYASRVLVTLTSACAVHCRYCFRRYFPYDDNNPGRAGWDKIMEYLQLNHAVNEVILSGGDPLSVSDTLLQAFTARLAAVPHIKRLRIHTRLPIVLPERITDEFIAWTQTLPFKLIIVIHCNHPQEINDDVHVMLKRLHHAGILVLNQSVLLKQVNDDADVLAELSEKLFAADVLPYYLHLLDKVEGAAHFDMKFETAQKIYGELAARLPGYLVPKLVREIPGELSKTFLSTGMI